MQGVDDMYIILSILAIVLSISLLELFGGV